MASAKQDLVLYKNGTLIANEILSSSSLSLATITHVQGTSPSWLVSSLLENAIQGTASLINSDLTTKVPLRSKVLLASFTNGIDYYHKNCRKNGIDLTQTDNFTFVDYFTGLFTEVIKNPSDASKSISTAFKLLEEKATGNDIVIIEAPEILLHATNENVDELLSHLLSVNRQCKQLFVIMAKDSPQFVQDARYMEFLVKLLHRSNLNISLLPLQTGRASDITGSLTITQGAIPHATGIPEVLEKEYIYHLTKDFNIKLFFR